MKIKDIPMISPTKMAIRSISSMNNIRNMFRDKFRTLPKEAPFANSANDEQIDNKDNNKDDDNNNNDNKQKLRTFTLYLIRHGEAEHNVQEKIAMEKAKKQALAEGLSPEETQQRMQTARQQVLDNPAFFDAPLSEQGQEQARAAADQIRQWTECSNSSDDGGGGCLLLPAPRTVLVSPLQRTLQTCDLIFRTAENTEIHVREELRERLTGRPADNRMASRHLQCRGSFSRFSFHHLRSHSMDAATTLLPFIEEGQYLEPDEIVPQPLGSSQNPSKQAEDEEAIQKRALQLFPLLSQMEQDTIAVVTHKGYLRALERGPFGQKDAKEFKNCEVHVYRISFLSGNTHIETIERLR